MDWPSSRNLYAIYMSLLIYLVVIQTCLPISRTFKSIDPFLFFHSISTAISFSFVFILEWVEAFHRSNRYEPVSTRVFFSNLVFFFFT